MEEKMREILGSGPYAWTDANIDTVFWKTLLCSKTLSLEVKNDALMKSWDIYGVCHLDGSGQVPILQLECLDKEQKLREMLREGPIAAKTFASQWTKGEIPAKFLSDHLVTLLLKTSQGTYEMPAIRKVVVERVPEKNGCLGFTGLCNNVEPGSNWVTVVSALFRFEV